MSEQDPLGVQMIALAGKLARAEVAVEQHNSTLAELNAVTGALRTSSGNNDKRTAELLDLVQKLAEKVTKLEGKASAPTPDRLWDWTSMDRVKAEKAWTELTGWVDTILVPWYDRLGDDQEVRSKRSQAGNTRKPRLRVPACWAWHRDVVIELSWLCQDWISLYRLQQGSAARAGDWHSKWLPGALHRIRNTSTASLCEIQHVALAGVADAPAEKVGLTGDVARAIELDLAARPEPRENPEARRPVRE